jgi:hypothetical protein
MNRKPAESMEQAAIHTSDLSDLLDPLDPLDPRTTRRTLSNRWGVVLPGVRSTIDQLLTQRRHEWPDRQLALPHSRRERIGVFVENAVPPHRR